MFSFNAIYRYMYIQLLMERLINVVPESYISVSMFVNVLAKAWDFFLLLFPFSWKYAGILLRSVYKTYGGPLSTPRFNEVCNIKVSVLRSNGTKCNDDQRASARLSHCFIARTSPPRCL